MAQVVAPVILPYFPVKRYNAAAKSKVTNKKEVVLGERGDR
jgi:hypothetical protein